MNGENKRAALSPCKKMQQDSMIMNFKDFSECRVVQETERAQDLKLPKCFRTLNNIPKYRIHNINYY